LAHAELLNWKIEVVDGFSCNQGFVEADRGVVSGVGSRKYYVGVLFFGEVRGF
jgi:hypothetical protein